eukprot:UN03774
MSLTQTKIKPTGKSSIHIPPKEHEIRKSKFSSTLPNKFSSTPPKPYQKSHKISDHKGGRDRHGRGHHDDQTSSEHRHHKREKVNTVMERKIVITETIIVKSIIHIRLVMIIKIINPVTATKIINPVDMEIIMEIGIMGVTENAKGTVTQDMTQTIKERRNTDST